jgi:hypothetical protein
MALYGQASAGLLLGAGVSFLPIPGRRPAGILAAFVALFTVAPLLYGLTGPISFTLAQIALLRLCARDDIVKERIAAALLVAFAAIFYPLALGAGPSDPFDLGYHPRLLLMLMVPVAILLAWRRQHIWLVIAGFDLVAYGLGLFDNLWSAFFDPVLVVLAGVRLATTYLVKAPVIDRSL